MATPAHTSPFDAKEINLHGLTPVPRSTTALFSSPHFQRTSPPRPYSPKDPTHTLPNTDLTTSLLEYARQSLPTPTLNHSLRVYHYGRAIHLQHFPSWSFSAETYLLCCLLHDIGTTPANLRKTVMSFEFWGGWEVLRVLEGMGAGLVQRESVAEAVVRHQDLGETGKIGAVGQLLQLATIYDNIGGNSDLVHEETIKNVVDEYPRLGWSKCFAATIREENGLKPWAHTTALGEDDFPNGVLGNKLMEPYE